MSGGPSTFYLFSTALAAGILAPLLLVPVKDLGRGFFILCTLISIVFYALALAVEGLGIGPLHASSAALLLAYNVTLPARGSRLSTLLLAAAALLANAGLLADARAFPAPPTLGAGAAAYLGGASLASGALLGSSITAMVLGHFYLVARGLSFAVLRRLTLAIAGALALRAAVMAAAAAAQGEWFRERWETLGAAGFGTSYGLFLGAQLLFGIAAPAVLVGMALVCVRDRANQSATGILYVLVAFVLIGEIISKHLLATSGLLA